MSFYSQGKDSSLRPNYRKTYNANYKFPHLYRRRKGNIKLRQRILESRCSYARTRRNLV